MRNREYKKCYKRLVKFQQLLFPLVDPDRWDNDYCAYQDGKDDNERYSAINPCSYTEHKTIEVRLHHATTDIRVILKWIRLLINIVNTQSYPATFSKADVLSWKGLKNSLKTYIRQNHKEDDWLEEQSRQQQEKEEQERQKLEYAAAVERQRERMAQQAQAALRWPRRRR